MAMFGLPRRAILSGVIRSGGGEFLTRRRQINRSGRGRRGGIVVGGLCYASRVMSSRKVGVGKDISTACLSCPDSYRHASSRPEILCEGSYWARSQCRVWWSRKESEDLYRSLECWHTSRTRLRRSPGRDSTRWGTSHVRLRLESRCEW